MGIENHMIKPAIAGIQSFRMRENDMEIFFSGQKFYASHLRHRNHACRSSPEIMWSTEQRSNPSLIAEKPGWLLGLPSSWCSWIVIIPNILDGINPYLYIYIEYILYIFIYHQPRRVDRSRSTTTGLASLAVRWLEPLWMVACSDPVSCRNSWPSCWSPLRLCPVWMRVTNGNGTITIWLFNIAMENHHF